MSLKALTSTHSCKIYPLSQAKDGMGGTKETLGSLTATKLCRVTPVGVEERIRYEQAGLNVTHRFLFHEDPSITLRTAIVYDDKVFRVRAIDDAGELGRLWNVVAEHTPQVELAAP